MMFISIAVFIETFRLNYVSKSGSPSGSGTNPRSIFDTDIDAGQLLPLDRRPESEHYSDRGSKIVLTDVLALNSEKGGTDAYRTE